MSNDGHGLGASQPGGGGAEGIAGVGCKAEGCRNQNLRGPIQGFKCCEESREGLIAAADGIGIGLGTGPRPATCGFNIRHVKDE